MIQSLPLTLGVANDVWVVLDALRRKRNASDYTGDAVQPGMVSEASAQAAGLLKALRGWLKAQHPDLLK